MASEKIQMLFLTVFCFFALLFLLPNYLGFKPDLLVLFSPFAVFVLFMEFRNKISFGFWVFLQVFLTAILLLVPFLIKAMI